MVASAHRHLSALAFAKALEPTARMLGVPDERDTLNSLDDVLGVAWNGTALEVVETPWEFSVHSPIPYDTPGVLIVHYLYRDASNHKRRATVALRGCFGREDIAILIGALSAGYEASFIPSQVGLHDLPFAMGYTPNFDEDDHVWHTLDGLAWRAQGSSDHDWEDIKPLWLARVQQGYDAYAALMEYERRGF